MDRFLIGWLLGERVVGGAGEGLDVRLWGVLAGGGEVERSLFVGDGPLQDIGLVRGGAVSVEVWTERELSAIQALWTLGVARGESVLRLRAEAAARWCVEALQPDNATGHPWGVNAFVGLSACGEVEAELYAQTLLHNCCVSRGVPDRFSSLVLLASLRSLESSLLL